MKKLIIIGVVSLGIFTTYAEQHCCHFHKCSEQRTYYFRPPCHNHVEKHDIKVWPSFAGSAIGTIIGNAILQCTYPTFPNNIVVQQQIIQQPTIQQTIVVQQQVVHKPVKVWIEGRYVEKIQENGSVVKIWQPGHYEMQ